MAKEREVLKTGVAPAPAALEDTIRTIIRQELERIGGPLRTAARPPLFLDRDLIERFIRAQRVRNSSKYVTEQRKMLYWWRDQLGGIDLRELDLGRHVVPKLDDVGAQPQRIAALKRLYSWLVKDLHLLDHTEDRTHALRVPQNKPEQWRHSKIVPLPVLMATRRRLEDLARDRLDVLLGTGWHMTELQRFARSGEIGPRPARGAKPCVAGVISTMHKSGEVIRTQVSSGVLEAATRVRAAGSFESSWFAKALRAACKKAGVERWTPGRIRHTVATHAVQNGDDPSAVAAFLGHKDQRTTRKFYAVHVAPRKVSTPL